MANGKNNPLGKALFFDAGPIISLVMSQLSWILPKLKEQFDGKFYITPAVRKELIERPLGVKRFEFEALQVMKMIDDGILEVYDQMPVKRASSLINLANNSFQIDGKSMDIIQSGEIESVSSALEIEASAVVMDERTLRLLMENGPELRHLLENRFNKKVMADKDKIKKFMDEVKSVKIIRSVELLAVAYKLGLLEGYVPKEKNGEELLLDAVLWTVKSNGCAVTSQEIDEMKKYLVK